MVELELEDEDGENLDCPKCGEGWLSVDRKGTMICQHCGAKYQRRELLKKIRKKSF